MPDSAAPETSEFPAPVRSGRIRHVLTARPWVTAVVAVVVVGGAVGGYALSAGGDDADSSAASAPTVTTRLVSPTTGTVRATVSTTGTIASADTEDVSFGSAATITSVKVAQGDKVTKGQVLGTIDTLALKATLAQAKSTLADAKSTYTDAENDSSSTDAQLEADRTSVASAKSAVGDAEDALTAATLRAPISGTVAEVNVATGDQATGSGSTAAGSTGGGTAGSGGGSSTTTTSSTSTGDFVVVGGAKWTVTASVDDTQVGLIAKNDQVQITTDNVTGTVFGTVSAVSVLSSSTSGSATYPVTIAVTGSPSGLHDGASATAAIVYKQATNVLTVATTAVHTENGASYVYVSSDGKKTKRTVTTGLASGGTTQITTGLTTNDKVYVQTLSRPAGAGNAQRSQSNQQGFPGGGNFPGGGTGNLPGGGNFPGGGTGNFPGRGAGGYGTGNR